MKHFRKINNNFAAVILSFSLSATIRLYRYAISNPHSKPSKTNSMPPHSTLRVMIKKCYADLDSRKAFVITSDGAILDVNERDKPQSQLSITNKMRHLKAITDIELTIADNKKILGVNSVASSELLRLSLRRKRRSRQSTDTL